MKRSTTLLPAALCVMLLTSWSTAQQPDTDAPVDGAKFPWPDPAASSPAAAQNVTGSLAVRVVQGTQGAPSIGAIDLELELHHRGMLVDTIKTRTDEHGVALFENLPIAMQVSPLVRVEYAHLTYQVEGGLMDAGHPQQQIDLVCYEPTEQPPPWHVKMRHVMIVEAQPPAEGLQVTEVMVIENPATHTWIGIPGTGGPNAKKITTAFPLPRGAQNVSLGRGFHDWCCSTLADGRLVNHLPLMPATTEMMFSYLVPARQGTATLDLTAPAGIDQMMVLVQDALTTTTFKGLELGGTEAMGADQFRFYLATTLSSGDSASLQLAGLRSAGKAMAPTAVGASQSMARIVAAVGGGLILLAAVALLVFMRGRRPAASGSTA